MPIIRSFRGISPLVHESVFVADNATLVGDVHIGERSTIWYGAVLRGDVHHIGSAARLRYKTTPLSMSPMGAFLPRSATA